MYNMLELSELFICLGGLIEFFSAWGNRKKLLGWGLQGRDQYTGWHYGFAVDKKINTLTKSDVITIQQINKFSESARDFVIQMLFKLFERSSLGSTLLRCAS